MKNAICGFLMFFAFATICFSQQNDPDSKSAENVILKSGARVSAQLLGVLDVASTKGGDDFVLTLSSEISGGGVNIPKGSEVLGRVVRVQEVNSESAISEISLSFDFVKNGEDYMTFKAIIMSGAKEGADTSKMVFTPSPVFKGATVISTRVKELRLEDGMVFQLKLIRDLVKP